MNLNEQSAHPAEARGELPAGPRRVETPSLEPAPGQTGFRRTVLTAGMAAALLVASGVPAVSAASPDPPASTTTVDQADG
jgi:hypothetical protein